MWQSKTAHLISRKQKRGKGKVGGPTILFKGTPLNDLRSPSRLHLLKLPAIPEGTALRIEPLAHGSLGDV
jgi:hypothetical protein